METVRATIKSVPDNPVAAGIRPDHGWICRRQEGSAVAREVTQEIEVAVVEQRRPSRRLYRFRSDPLWLIQDRICFSELLYPLEPTPARATISIPSYPANTAFAFPVVMSTGP